MPSHQHSHSSSSCGAHGHHHEAQAKEIDPVCGMSVDPNAGKPRFDFQGKTHHFCSNSCRTKFEADPLRYLDKNKAPKIDAPKDATYTCPMHPEVRQIGPGSCPLCGMALEPELVTLDSGPNPELIDFTRRFWIGLAFALPVVVLDMGAQITGHDLIEPRLSQWIQFAFATPVVAWAALDRKSVV